MDDLSIGIDELLTDEELIWDANNASASKPTVEPPEETETTNADLDNVLKAFVQQRKAKNTVTKTRSDLNVWTRWCKSVNEQRELQDLPSHALNRLLSHFFKSVAKKNREDYEPGTLTSYQRSIDRYLRDIGQTRSILGDPEFEGSRQVLEAKRKLLRREGRGRKSNAAAPVTEPE